MKSLTLIFCGEDGVAAKAMAATLRNDHMNVAVGSAFEFDGQSDEGPCRVVVMPDVPKWHRERLDEAYPGLTATPLQAVSVAIQEWKETNAPLTIRHKGFGKFFVMRGEEVVSGPHSKTEAQARAA